MSLIIWNAKNFLLNKFNDNFKLHIFAVNPPSYQKKTLHITKNTYKKSPQIPTMKWLENEIKTRVLSVHMSK